MYGLVLKSTGKWYEVKSDEGIIYQCDIKGRLRLKGISTTNPVSAGDRVSFEIDSDSQGHIISIEERKNYIIRRSVNLSKEAQIVAANLDQAFLIVTMRHPQTTPGFIDRFLVTADAYGIPAILVFHKMDQYEEKDLNAIDQMIAVYTNAGYYCLKSSITDGRGIEEFGELMKGKINLISGHSGTGKSSLVNRFIPDKNLRIGDISVSSDKGQHTTTFAEMHELPFGGYIVDTPGIKGFGLVDIPKEELNHHFKEFFALLPECKFNNCKHLNEPGCRVIKALATGEIAQSRYNSYRSMMDDEDERSTYR
jgi:ribosome biogenesis GTPase / thiamine phosphate phosphatase